MEIIKDFKSTNKKGEYKFVRCKLQKKYNCNHCYINEILKTNIKIIILILFIFIIISFEILRNIYKKLNIKDDKIKEHICLDKYETNIYEEIREKLLNNQCSQMWANQREFLNGVIRYFKPKKIVEIGVAEGGGTSIILNAIQDIENSHLYSIDLSDSPNIGKCAKNLFPQFLNKWTLFTGNVAAKFMEQIGNNIDMVFIDSAHFEPGEILDFIIVLPFLKEGAIVGFHDIANQMNNNIKQRNEWAPYIIFNIIRGIPYYPSGKIFLKHDIGIKVLNQNQKQYYHDYFRALGGQWQYFPKESHIKLINELFQKYYDIKCRKMFQETVEFNRIFVKNNPMNQIYGYNSD